METDAISRLQDLRIKIVNGETVSPEEYFEIMMNLRKGRREAAGKAPKSKKTKVENPDDLLNTFLEL